mmetsp:Transcript_3274/g.4772  ORF Transcript_3274/g.4772 Transcript_3274/m.4772 type:complete len:265 (-) Transcript_3274:3600-4394(-)
MQYLFTTLFGLFQVGYVCTSVLGGILTYPWTSSSADNPSRSSPKAIGKSTKKQGRAKTGAAEKLPLPRILRRGCLLPLSVVETALTLGLTLGMDTYDQHTGKNGLQTWFLSSQSSPFQSLDRTGLVLTVCKYVYFFLLFDFGYYTIHRMWHAVPLLKRFFLTVCCPAASSGSRAAGTLVRFGCFQLPSYCWALWASQANLQEVPHLVFGTAVVLSAMRMLPLVQSLRHQSEEEHQISTRISFGLTPLFDAMFDTNLHQLEKRVQ